MQSNNLKFLVAIEGSDGSGKSTLIQALEARARQRSALPLPARLYPIASKHFWRAASHRRIRTGEVAD
jgi:ABC-type phosphate/phosphonate transport system ATPase subunit